MSNTPGWRIIVGNESGSASHGSQAREGFIARCYRSGPGRAIWQSGA